MMNEQNTGGLRGLYRSVAGAADNESEALLRMIRRCAQPDARILDVGCGYGRNLDLLIDAGFRNTLGVEVNPEIVSDNKARGLPCVTVDEFEKQGGLYDLILMSHVIEHFAPSALKEFMDGYLGHLVPGGCLVIATPLMSDYFYDDFDHVKPYQPIGIMMVFGGSKAQVQYYSKSKLELMDIWFRKSPLRPSFHKGLYLKTAGSRLLQLIIFLGALLFIFSNKLIGRKDGWIGVFRKINGT